MKNRKIPKTVWILGFVSLFTDFASEMLYPVTPLFLSATLGASMSLIGLIEGIAEITAGLLKGYFGFLSDKIQKRSIFVKTGYTLSAIAKPLPGFLPFIPTVISSRVIDRIGKGIRTAPRDALLAESSNDNSGAIFGFHRGMDTLGAVLGPITALILLNYFTGNYILIYFVAIIPSFFALLFAFIVKDLERVTPDIKSRVGIKIFWKEASKEYKLLLIILTAFSFVNSSDVFLILKTQNVSGSDTTALLGYIFYNIIYSASSYPIGIISDKFGKPEVFISGLVIFSLVYLGFGISTNYFINIILFGIYGIYAASTEGISKAWISDIIPSHFRGTAIGMVTTFGSFGIMLGSIFAGFLWDNFGSTVPFILSSAVSLLLAIILIFIRKSSLSGHSGQ
ncbi:MAG: MFS transporter [Melioribacteraceae bacterium]|nr:MFS transporter [Melioribacteraceae bacterium]